MDMMTLMGPIIVIFIVVMVIMMFVKMIKGFTTSKKKRQVDVPRSPAERLILYYKESMQFNRCGAFKIKISGDSYKKGYFLGWGIYGVVADNHEYVFFVRRKRWFTKEKATMFVVEPHLVKDLNTRELVVEARGTMKIGPVLYPIPTADTPKGSQDRLWQRRDENFQMKLLQILSYDLNTDLVESPKAAIRNSILQATREEFEIGEMEKMDEEARRDEIKRKDEEIRQERTRRSAMEQYRQTYGPGAYYPGMGYTGKTGGAG
jgi:hypothetical protein